jgi:hypothetical protein
MEQHVFCIFIDYRGRHRKGVAIYDATLVNLQQKLWFHIKKECIFEHYREFQTIRNLLIGISLVIKIFFC